MFKITDFVPKKQMVLQPFEGYWGAKPLIGKLIVTEINDGQARLLAAQSGQADIVTRGDYTVKKKNVVQLSEAERAELESVVTKGKAGARIIRRAHTLLLSDEGRSDREIATLLHVDELTVVRTRQRWAARHELTDKPRRHRGRRLDGKQEALLVALACSEAPEGRSEWTMQLLADKLLGWGVVEDAISPLERGQAIYMRGVVGMGRRGGRDFG